MNYNMQGITDTIRKLFVMLKSTKVEINKNIKCWWLTRPLVSRKWQRERKGTSSRMTSKLSLPRRSPQLDQSLKLSAYTTKEMVTGSGNALNIWWIRRMARWTRVYFIYRLLMCTLLVFIVAPAYWSSSQSSCSLVEATGGFCQWPHHPGDLLPAESSGYATQTIWAHAH